MLTQPEFRAHSCTRYRYRYSECGACARACPHDAIALSDAGIAISDTACQNCALCVAACPAEALAARNLPRLEILRRAIKQPEVTFACAPSGASADETVPCLGALDAVMLATLAGHGIAVALAGTHHCGECPHGERAAHMLARHLEAVEALRQCIGNAKWAAITVKEGGEAKGGMDHDASRRHLFRRFLGRTANDVAEAVSGSEPQPVPMKAIRIAAPVAVLGRELLQKLFDTAPDGTTGMPHHEALFAARVELAPGCTACEVCARACPTGAMKIAENAVSWALTFQFSRCTGCGVCLETCQPRVLHFAEAMTGLPAVRDAVTLHNLAKQRCSHCDRFFISSGPEEVCPICRGDDDDFAAIFG